MAWTTAEKALALMLGYDEIVLRGKGIAARTAKTAVNASARAIVAAGSLGARAAPVAARGGAGLARGALGLGAAYARKHPVVAGAAGLVGAHELGYFDPVYEALERERQMAAASYAISGPTIIPELEATYITPVKRKVSKANRAVKEGMTWLKKKGKALTGSAPGILPAKAFLTATQAAGMANPQTKSKPGKGKSKKSRLSRYIAKWWKR